MAENKWLRLAAQSWKLLCQHRWLVVGSVLADLLFLFLLGLITTPLHELLVTQIINIGAALSHTAYVAGSLLQQALLPEARPFFNRAVLFWVSNLVITYFLYAILQGSAWFFCARIARSNKSWRQYVRRFALMNLFWLCVYALLQLADLFFSLQHKFLTLTTQTSITNVPALLLGVISFILGIIAAFSYAVTTLSGGLRVSLDAHRSIPLLIILSILGLNADALLSVVAKIHPVLLIVVGVIVFLPLLTLARVYIILLTQLDNVGSQP